MTLPVHRGEYLDGRLVHTWNTNLRVMNHEGRVSSVDACQLAGMCDAFEAFMVKYASIKGSSAPSITAATLPDS